MRSMFLQILTFATWFVGYVALASFCEWALHRFIMHKPLGKFDYPFKAHALVHHQLFRADHSYHLQKAEDAKKIPMAWWNGPVLILIFTVLFAVPVSLLKGNWINTPAATLAVTLYYLTYERIHYCMHSPKRRIIETWPFIGWIFRRLNGHHILHHRYMGKNFNVVMPLADFCLGTLLLRSKIPFRQPAIGGPVPDVQPRLIAKSRSSRAIDRPRHGAGATLEF